MNSHNGVALKEPFSLRMLGSPDVKTIPQKNVVQDVLSMPEKAFREVYEWNDGTDKTSQPGILHNPPQDVWRKDDDEYKKVFAGDFSANTLEKVVFRAQKKDLGSTKVFVLMHDPDKDKLTDVRGLMASPQFNGATFQFASTMFGPLEGGKYAWTSKLETMHRGAVQGEFASISTIGATIWRKYFLPGKVVDNFTQQERKLWKKSDMRLRTQQLTRKMYTLEHFRKRLPYKVFRHRSHTSYAIDKNAVTKYTRRDEDVGLVKIPIHKNVYVLYGYGTGKDADGNPLPKKEKDDNSPVEVVGLKRNQRVSCALTSTIDIRKYTDDEKSTREVQNVQEVLQEAAYTGAIYGAVWAGSKKVVLTFVGGGSFRNDPDILYSKMITVLNRAISDALDVEIYINYRYDGRRETASSGVEKKNLHRLINIALSTQGMSESIIGAWDIGSQVNEYIDAYINGDSAKITDVVDQLYTLQNIELAEKKIKKRKKEDIKEPLRVFTTVVEGGGTFSRPPGDSFDGQAKDAMVTYPGDPLWLARQTLSGEQARELMLAYDFYIRYKNQLQLLLDMKNTLMHAATKKKTEAGRREHLPTKFLFVLSQMESYNRQLGIWIESIVKQEKPKGKGAQDKIFEMNDLLLVLEQLQNETSSILTHLAQEAQALRASGVKKEPFVLKPKAELLVDQADVVSFVQKRMRAIMKRATKLDVQHEFFNFSELPVLYSMVHARRDSVTGILPIPPVPMDNALGVVCTFSNGYPSKPSGGRATHSGVKSIQMRIQLSPLQETRVLLFQFTIEYASMTSFENPVDYDLHTARFGYLTRKNPESRDEHGTVMYVFSTSQASTSNRLSVELIDMTKVQHEGLDKDSKKRGWTDLFLPLDSEGDPSDEILRIRNLFSDAWSVNKELERESPTRATGLPHRAIDVFLSVSVNVEAVMTTRSYHKRLKQWLKRKGEGIEKPVPRDNERINVYPVTSDTMVPYNYYNAAVVGLSEDQAMINRLGPHMHAYVQKIHRFKQASARRFSRVNEEISDSEDVSTTQSPAIDSVLSTKESPSGAMEIGEEENKCDDFKFLGVVEEM